MATYEEDDIGDDGIMEHNYEDSGNTAALAKLPSKNSEQKEQGKAISLSEVQKEFDKAGIQLSKQGTTTEAALKQKWPQMGLGR